MPDDTSLLGKLLIGIFILEIIGIFFAYTFGANDINGANSNFMSATSGFNSFTSLINGTTFNIANAFSSCSFKTLSCSKPISQIATSDQSWFLSGVANAVIWIGNILITIIDLIINAIWLLINIIALILLMIGLFGYIFVVFLPLVMTSIGPIGDLLTIGYVLIICVAGYKYGHIILNTLKIVISAAEKYI